MLAKKGIFPIFAKRGEEEPKEDKVMFTEHLNKNIVETVLKRTEIWRNVFIIN